MRRADQDYSGVKLYQLGKVVYNRYREAVKGNNHIDQLTAQKKLTRNIMLGLKIEIDNKVIMYMYGNLHIFVRGNKITWIKNVKNTSGNWFYKDEALYAELNKKLGISDDDMCASQKKFTKVDELFQRFLRSMARRNALT